jgi:hypothetical protein
MRKRSGDGPRRLLRDLVVQRHPVSREDETGSARRYRDQGFRDCRARCAGAPPPSRRRAIPTRGLLAAPVADFVVEHARNAGPTSTISTSRTTAPRSSSPGEPQPSAGEVRMNPAGWLRKKGRFWSCPDAAKEMRHLPASERAMSHTSRLYLRALQLRCLACGGRPVFVSWFRMCPNCPSCGLHFDREPEGGYRVALHDQPDADGGGTRGGLPLGMWATWPQPPWDLLVTAISPSLHSCRSWSFPIRRPSSLPWISIFARKSLRTMRLHARSHPTPPALGAEIRPGCQCCA